MNTKVVFYRHFARSIDVPFKGRSQFHVDFLELRQDLVKLIFLFLPGTVLFQFEDMDRLGVAGGTQKLRVGAEGQGTNANVSEKEKGKFVSHGRNQLNGTNCMSIMIFSFHTQKSLFWRYDC